MILRRLSVRVQMCGTWSNFEVQRSVCISLVRVRELSSIHALINNRVWFALEAMKSSAQWNINWKFESKSVRINVTDPRLRINDRKWTKQRENEENVDRILKTDSTSKEPKLWQLNFNSCWIFLWTESVKLWEKYWEKNMNWKKLEIDSKHW